MRTPLKAQRKAPRNTPRGKPHLVVAIAYDRLCTFEFGCAVEVFALPGPPAAAAQAPWYRFAVCAAEPGPLRATGGVTVTATYSLKLLDLADTIVIPGWRDIHEPPPPALLRKLQAAHARGARIASICSGAFVLAAAGLLDGKTATTHWLYAPTLAARHPRITVSPNALYVDQGQLITSAGSAAGLDMLLHLVRHDHGAKVANHVAQRLVMPPHREGGQAQFVPRAVAPCDDSRLATLMEWVRAHPALPHTVTALAQRVAMSPRTFQRQFKNTTGLTPYDWVLRERVALAREWLETTPAGVKQIAERAGFGDEFLLRKHFQRVVGTSPSAYRRRFTQTG